MVALALLAFAASSFAQTTVVSGAVGATAAGSTAVTSAAGGTNPNAPQNGLTINTPPALITCQPVLLQWQGGSAPYFVSIIPGGQSSAAALEQFPQTNDNSYTWNVDLAAGTSVTIRVSDASGVPNYSSPVTIQAGQTTSCAGSNASADAGGSVTAGSSTTAVGTTTAGGSTSRPAGASSTTSATLVGSSSSSASASSSSSSSAAQALNKKAAGSLFGLIGAATWALMA